METQPRGGIVRDLMHSKALLIGGNYYVLVPGQPKPRLHTGMKIRAACDHWDHYQGNGQSGVLLDCLLVVADVRMASVPELTVARNSNKLGLTPKLSQTQFAVIELEHTNRDAGAAFSYRPKYQLHYLWWFRPSS